MDWGVPDWTDEDAYPRDQTIREWWWQFTRRHPDYRRLWLEFEPYQARMIETNMDHCVAMAESDGCTLEEYLQWKRDQAPTRDPEMMRRRFKMSVLLNPAKSFHDSHLMLFLYRDSASAVTYGCFEPVQQDQDNGRVLIRFNLNRPLEEQLAYAKNYLSDMQKHEHGKAIMRRPRRTNWPLFLRVLDARDAGATFEEIAGVLWPGQDKTPQSARDAHLAACQLREDFPI